MMTKILRLMILFAAVLFLVGVFAPNFRLAFSVGDPVADAILMDFYPKVMAPREYSIAGAVGMLLREHGNYPLGLTILGFSILFPIGKLCILAMLTTELRPRGLRSTALISRNSAEWFVEALGRWSMIDVLIVAVLLVGTKEFPGGSRIVWRWGIYCFGASVLLTLLTSTMLSWLNRTRPNSLFQVQSIT